jgi:hypothetical protein
LRKRIHDFHHNKPFPSRSKKAKALFSVFFIDDVFRLSGFWEPRARLLCAALHNIATA